MKKTEAQSLKDEQLEEIVIESSEEESKPPTKKAKATLTLLTNPIDAGSKDELADELEEDE